MHIVEMFFCKVFPTILALPPYTKIVKKMLLQEAKKFTKIRYQLKMTT